MGKKIDRMLQFRNWLQGQPRDAAWCVLINADPDAMASAMALKRILRNRARSVEIRRINVVTRPDNLAMIRYLRIPMSPWRAEDAQNYTRFAILDSQPSHHKDFGGLKYDLVIDHHPPTELEPFLSAGAYTAIRTAVGATSTLMMRLLRAFAIRPGPMLATGLMYGIRTDTAAFSRSGGEEDLFAYRWLSHYSRETLLRRIIRSEYLLEWLPLFSRAFRSLTDCRAGGANATLGDVSSPDLLVAVADFFTKVHGLRWITVAGKVGATLIVIFRGDGASDMGEMAQACFGALGQAGGHRALARAEFPVSAVPEGIKPADFVLKTLQGYHARHGRKGKAPEKTV